MLTLQFVLPFTLEKGSVDGMKLTGAQIGKQAAAKSKGLFSAEDWMCSKYVFTLICNCHVLIKFSRNHSQRDTLRTRGEMRQLVAGLKI